LPRSAHRENQAIREAIQLQVTRKAKIESSGKRIEYVFFHQNGRKIKDFRKSWENACEAAGVPGMLFHDLRTTAVRNLIRAGVPQSVAKRISGHETDSVFERYTLPIQPTFKSTWQG